MKYFSKGFFGAVSLTALLAWPTAGQAAQLECDSEASRVKAVSRNDVVTSVNDFQGSGAPGTLGFTLLTTTIMVGGTTPSCVIAHFSAETDIGDNHVIFQVSLDGVPMNGHALFPLLGPTFTTPVVFHAATSFKDPQTVAYNFFKSVSPGMHTVEVKFATCCSTAITTGTTDILAAVLTLEYQKNAAAKKDDDDDDHRDKYKTNYNQKYRRR